MGGKHDNMQRMAKGHISQILGRLKYLDEADTETVFTGWYKLGNFLPHCSRNQQGSLKYCFPSYTVYPEIFQYAPIQHKMLYEVKMTF